MLAVVAEQRANSVGADPVAWKPTLASRPLRVLDKSRSAIIGSDRPPTALWQCRRATSPISSAIVLGDYARSTAPVSLTSGVLPFIPLARVGPTTPTQATADVTVRP